MQFCSIKSVFSNSNLENLGYRRVHILQEYWQKTDLPRNKKQYKGFKIKERLEKERGLRVMWVSVQLLV